MSIAPDTFKKLMKKWFKSDKLEDVKYKNAKLKFLELGSWSLEFKNTKIKLSTVTLTYICVMNRGIIKKKDLSWLT